MYIEPNTTIYLLRNVPLDNTYTDTMWFENASSQWTHFKTRVDANGEIFAKNTYQRKNINRCRLEVPADRVYDCNYMMFQNTNYGNKWFYAFITQVEYINNAVTEIEYELDVMQTWMFEYTLEMCMVEREHSSTDQIGDNLMSEPFDLGEYVVDSWEKDDWIDDTTQGTGGYSMLICMAQQNGGG